MFQQQSHTAIISFHLSCKLWVHSPLEENKMIICKAEKLLSLPQSHDETCTWPAACSIMQSHLKMRLSSVEMASHGQWHHYSSTVILRWNPDSVLCLCQTELVHVVTKMKSVKMLFFGGGFNPSMTRVLWTYCSLFSSFSVKQKANLVHMRVFFHCQLHFFFHHILKKCRQKCHRLCVAPFSITTCYSSVQK